MPYSADYTDATTIAVRNVVQMAMINAAIQIYAESPSTPGHTARSSLAVEVLNKPNDKIMAFLFAVCTPAATNGPITTSSTDAQVDAAISSVWNAIAGV